MPPNRDDILKKYRVGTPADTPGSLRVKAADFLRMAADSRDLQRNEEMRLLATLYLERARELEKAGTIGADVGPGKTQRG